MKKATTQKSSSLSKSSASQRKDKYKGCQLMQVDKVFFRGTYTMLMAAKITGIERANVCRHVAELKRNNKIAIVRKGICPISRRNGVQFLTTNKSLFPKNKQTSLILLMGTFDKQNQWQFIEKENRLNFAKEMVLKALKNKPLTKSQLAIEKSLLFAEVSTYYIKKALYSLMYENKVQRVTFAKKDEMKLKDHLNYYTSNTALFHFNTSKSW